MRHADNLTVRPDDLIFDNVSLNFGGKSVLHGLSFRVPAGGCVALMGASGSGKTSVLKLAAQLLTPTAGRVSGGGRISMQFQEPRLLPWRNAAENVNLVLSDTAKTLPESLTWLTSVDLRDAVGLYPDELSGGMAQRVALCRALAAPADTVLLDEPFRGLDPDTRHRVMTVVRQATCAAGRTLLLVTPAEEDAILHAATNKSRMERSNTNDYKQSVTAEANLRDMAELLAKQRQEKEPLIHCGVYLDIAATDTEKLRTARDTVTRNTILLTSTAFSLLQSEPSVRAHHCPSEHLCVRPGT